MFRYMSEEQRITFSRADESDKPFRFKIGSVITNPKDKGTMAAIAGYSITYGKTLMMALTPCPEESYLLKYKNKEEGKQLKDLGLEGHQTEWQQ